MRYDLEPASVEARKRARASSVKQDTRPELALPRAIWAAGYRYRKNVATLPGTREIMFIGPKIAVFVDGEFWHGWDCESRRKKLLAGHNAEYWVAKIERNKERDAKRTVELEADGWTVLRFWELEVKRELRNVVRKSQNVWA